MARNLYGEGEFTEAKQAHVREIFRKHLAIVANLAKKWPAIRCYTQMDLYAGHGGEDAFTPGSPMIFLDEAHARGFPVHLCCVEKNKGRASSLVGRIRAFSQAPIVPPEGGFSCVADVVDEACEQAAPRWLREQVASARRTGEWMRGLIYADPNGELAWDTVRELVGIAPHLDVLIYYSPNMRKRVRCCGKTYQHDQLIDLLTTLGKRRWFIREPAGNKEWTFLFGTNFDGQDGIKRIGFWPVDSERGAAILRDANFTVKERTWLPINGQLPLL